jgi:hypothetical protein
MGISATASVLIMKYPDTRSHLSGSADGALYHWSGTERALLGSRPDAHSGGARGASVVGAPLLTEIYLRRAWFCPATADEHASAGPF